MFIVARGALRPTAPVISITNITSGSGQVNLVAPAIEPQTGVKSYLLQQQFHGGSLTFFETIATIAPTGFPYTFSSNLGGNLTPNTQYTIQLVAVDGSPQADEGPPSNVVTFTTATAPSPPTVTLTANPTSISAGGSTTLTWSTTNATSCTASGGWSGSQATSGSTVISSIETNTSFTLTATGPGGTGSASAAVSVTGTQPAPTVTLTANPSVIASGGTATLTWSTTNATSCTASGSWSGAKATSGTASTGGLSSTSTFTLTATGAGGTASATATVTVDAASGIQFSPGWWLELDEGQPASYVLTRLQTAYTTGGTGLKGAPGLKGIFWIQTWNAFENNENEYTWTSGGLNGNPNPGGFAMFDPLIAACAAAGLKWVFGMQAKQFGGWYANGPATMYSTLPLYFANLQMSDGSTGGALFTTQAANQSGADDGLLITAKMYDSVVIARYAAMLQAYGAHYAGNQTVEGWRDETETANALYTLSGVGPGDSAYTNQAAQLGGIGLANPGLSLAAQMREAFSNSLCSLCPNFMDTAQQMYTLISGGASYSIAMGGPDTLANMGGWNANTNSYGNPPYTSISTIIFNGAVNSSGALGGTDFRNHSGGQGLPWICETQDGDFPISNSAYVAAGNGIGYLENVLYPDMMGIAGPNNGPNYDIKYGGSVLPSYWFLDEIMYSNGNSTTSAVLQWTPASILNWIATQSQNYPLNTTYPASYGGFDYYIGPNGSDNNLGTVNSPWAYTSINSKQSVYAGKTVGVLNGTYNFYALLQGITSGSESAALSVNGGTSSSPTIIAAVNPRQAIFTAVNPSTGALPTNACGMIGQGGGNPPPNLGNVILDGLVVTGGFQYGISFYLTNVAEGSGVQGITVRNCQVSNIGGVVDNNVAGIFLQGVQAAFIHHNKIFNVQPTGGNQEDVAGIMSYYSHSNVYENNTIYNCCCSVRDKYINNGNHTHSYNYYESNGVQPIAAVFDCSGGGAGDTLTFNNNLVLCPTEYAFEGEPWPPSWALVQSYKVFNNTFIYGGNGNNSALYLPNLGNQTSPAATVIKYNNIYSTVSGNPGYQGETLFCQGAVTQSDYEMYSPVVASGNYLDISNQSFTSPSQGPNVPIYEYTLSQYQTALHLDMHSIAAAPSFVSATYASSTGTPNPSGWQLQGGTPGSATSASPGYTGGTSTGTPVDKGAWGGAALIGCGY